MTDGKYDDILELSYPRPSARRRMTNLERAAQFSPFAALTGYDAAVRETARLTDTKAEMTEDEKELLDAKLQLLAAHVEEEPTVSVVYFSPDKRKAGGAYLELVDRVVKIDVMDGEVSFAGGARIPVGDIRSIDGELVSILNREG